MARTTATKPAAELSVEQLARALQAAQEVAAMEAAAKARPGMVRQGSRTVYRLRRQLVPHTVIGLLWTGAGAANVAPAIARFYGASLDPTTLATSVSAIYTVVALVWWWAWGSQRPELTSRRWRRRYTTFVMLCAGGWLVWAATAGPGSWRAAVLGVGGSLLAAPRWYRHRLRIPEPEVPAGPPQEEMATRTQRRWTANVAGKGRILDGSFLLGPEQAPFGEAYTGQLVRGRQAFSTVLANLPLIASGLDCDLDEVVVTRHPQGSQSRFRLTVIDRARNPLHRVIPYPGGTYDAATGLVRVGTYADGDATAWRTWEPGSGLYGGTVIGGIGAGKSRLLEGLGSSHAHAVDPVTGRGLFVVWVIDPQGGASLPAMAKHADWAATEPDEIARMLQAGDRVLTWRSKVQALHGRSHFDPTPEIPGLIIFIDECHELFIPGSEEEATAERLARKGRKNGIALIVASQYPGLPTFGNNEALRSSLMKVNSVVMRTASKSSRGIIPGLELDPFELPDLPGFGYTVSRNGKTAPFRAYYVEDPEFWASTAPGTTLEDVSAAAAGEDYRSRHARREAARAQLAAEIRAVREGGVVLSAPAKKAGPVRRAASAAVHVPAPRMPKDTDTSAMDRVLGVIGGGARRTGEIIAQSGYSETWVRTMLKSLINTGKVDRVGHGDWELTDSGWRYLAQLDADDSSVDVAELLIAAVELVVTTQVGSVGLLQRDLRIGVVRASQLMDTLHRVGVVGPAQGSQPRDVLVAADDLPHALDRVAAAQVA